jgi:tripartite-type tricarboxylate transporter receptor subunit TctC
MWNARLLAGLASLSLFSHGGFAAVTEFPSKPLRYISASGPGGASDLIARTVGAAMSEVLGVQIVVDNRPGAGNTIGAELASRAVPDGYTIFGCNIASLAVAPALYRKLSYDPDRDFVPLGLVASNPNVLTINPSVRAATISEFISIAKAQPGKLNYASAGVGSSPQLSMELFKMQAGLDIVHIPYKGIAPAIPDLIAGRVQAMFSTVPSVLSAVRSGKVRALGVTSLQRDTDLPDVPTIAESGLADFEVTSWQAVCARSGVPQAALEKLRAALATALDQAETRKRLVSHGFQLRVMSAEQADAFIRAERAKWTKLVKQIGIPLQ